ncbi:MAG: hypothetical protein V4658_14910 [Bacteroidota bacterium]
MGSVFVFRFSDLLAYVFIALVIALFIGMNSSDFRKTFLLWFVFNLVLTPLAGLIYLLIKITSSK